MTEWSVDLETKSGADIGSTGLYRYAQDPEFDILLFAYARGDEPVQLIDLALGEKIPPEVVEALEDPKVIKHAHNAAFEWYCLNQYGIKTPLESWRCDMIHGMYCGYPGSLAMLNEALGIPEDKRKLTTGKALIRFFCCPSKPTKADPDRWKNPRKYPEKWQQFREYCMQDVATERENEKRLSNYPVPESEWHLWHMDVAMNAYGVRLDEELVSGALKVNDISMDHLLAEAKELTGLENPNSNTQMLAWVNAHGVKMDSLAKEPLSEALSQDLPSEVRQALELKSLIGKTSIKKYQSMEKAKCSDGYIRGVSQFYGANRTGRYAGRLIQLQNMTKNHIDTLDFARDVVRAGDYDSAKFFYGNVPDLLSQLIRTALIPSEGRHFVVADFSAIEARVIAWLAGEEWAMKEFAGAGKIYEATAAQMFHVPKEKIKKGNPEYALRQKGKVATLACIAAGSEVLTNVGLVPIENVTTDMLLWDGQEWVSHEGVIFKGIRKVIEYDGLTATEDHLVFIEGEQGCIQFGVAASSRARLLQTGDGGREIRLGGDHQSGETVGQELAEAICSDEMHGMRTHPVDVPGQPEEREVERVPELLATSGVSEVVVQEVHSSEGSMHKSEGSGVQELRGARDYIRLSECEGCSDVHGEHLRGTGQEDGDRQDRHEPWVCPVEYEILHKEREHLEQAYYSSVGVYSGMLAVRGDSSQEEAGSGIEPGADNRGSEGCCVQQEKKLARHKGATRVYDIRNAGPRHRFTVSGRLVHNCGYGGGTGALINMGALKMGLPEEELPDILKRWRDANQNIVKLWSDLDKALMKVMRTAKPVRVGYVVLALEGDMQYGQCFLTAELPTGRKLYYPKPHLAENRFGNMTVHYFTVDQTTRKWGTTDTWGGKFSENLCQAIARDCLTEVLLRIEKKGWQPVFHVHDEVIIDAPLNVHTKDLCDLMAEPIPWAPGLILSGAGFESMYYMKD